MLERTYSGFGFRLEEDAASWERVTVWSLSYLNMRWCLTLGETILPILY
jgi:hypothetical protein